ncbi:MAG: IS66 family transposase zinc-finger binding domain-containing protein [Candidatus Omnitrophota bacterium]
MLRYPIKKKRKRWKKLGRPEGHPGTTRKKPEVIDNIEHQTLKVCPDCGCKELTELPSEVQEHIPEDLVPAKVEATKYIQHGYWCPCCKQKKEAPYAAEEIPYGYLGPNILIQAVLMKYH